MSENEREIVCHPKGKEVFTLTRECVNPHRWPEWQWSATAATVIDAKVCTGILAPATVYYTLREIIPLFNGMKERHTILERHCSEVWVNIQPVKDAAKECNGIEKEKRETEAREAARGNTP